MTRQPVDDTLVQTVHRRRPGITEDLLTHVRDAAGRTPYRWLVESLGAGPVVDLCCGSAPVADLVGADRYLGWDRSAAEIAAARRRRPDVAVDRVDALHPGEAQILAEAHVAAVPGATQVTVAMALMLLPLEPLLAAVDGWAGGDAVLHAIVPTRDPAWTGPAYQRLLELAGVADTPFPEPLHDLAERARSCGWRLATDLHATFAAPLTSAAHSARLAGSFYAQAGKQAVLAAHLDELRRAGAAAHPYPLRLVRLRRAATPSPDAPTDR